MPRLPLLVLFYSALLGGCSPESGIEIDKTPGNPDSTPGLVSGDDESNQLSTSNYAAVVTTSMNLLRANYFPEAVALLEQLTPLWGSMRNSVVGIENFNCPQGGVVTRTVTQAPDLPESGLPDLNTKSALLFNACELDGKNLSGDVQWDWDESSPTQLSATSYHNNFRFDELTITDSASEKRLTGSYDRLVTIAGPGDSYTNNSVTDSFIEISNGASTIVSNGTYNQRFSHFVAQSDQPNGIGHTFSESGTAKLKIDALRLVGATINLDPVLVYANEQTPSSVAHTTNLASGELSITLPSQARLAMASNNGSPGTVTYSIVGSDQQEVVIEREWLAPAKCLNDARFNYDSCL